MSIDVVNLSDPSINGVSIICAELAERHATEWGHLYDPSVWNVSIALSEFTAMAAGSTDDVTLVAFDGPDRGIDSVVGSVSLLATDDLIGWESHGPWLASLYIWPEHRGTGIARALIDELTAYARSNGHERLHLFTDTHQAFYLNGGWRILGKTTTPGGVATVMGKGTSTRSARRSVVTKWISNDNIGGAYSYLRAGGSPADRDTIGTEVLPKVWLAGEHTWSASPGTMHGAWFSGERAATEVLHSFGSPAQSAALTAAAAPTVAVVGAGMAGIAAARVLAGAGVTVTVYEASSVIGGRVETDWSLGVPLHLGAAWIHGAQGHPMAGAVSTIPRGWGDTPTFVIGRGMLPADVDARLAAVAEKIETALDVIGRDHPTDGLGPALRTLITERVDDPDERAVLLMWFRDEYEHLYAAPLDDLSLRWRAEPFRLPGVDEMVTSPINDWVAEKVRALSIECDRRVTTIRSLGDRVSLTFASGEAIEVDAAISTTPIPTIQRGFIAFEPALPLAVSDAIARISCGPVAKVFVTFDEAFWAPHTVFRVSGQTPQPLELFVDVTALTGVPTLCIFSVGDHARTAELMSEDERCRLIDRLLTEARVGLDPDSQFA